MSKSSRKGTECTVLVKHDVHQLLVGLDLGEGDGDDMALRVVRDRFDQRSLPGAWWSDDTSSEL